VERALEFKDLNLKVTADRRPLRVYTAGFLVALGLYLAVQGPGQLAVVWAAAIAAILLGALAGKGGLLKSGVIIATLLALIFPIVRDAAANGKPLFEVIEETAIWPQLLVSLVGSRVLASESELAFVTFWQQPLKIRDRAGIQSFAAAAALGGFLTLVFYLIVPQLLPPAPQHSFAIVLSALRGGTAVHATIIWLFFAILALILDAARLHMIDRSVVSAFCRRLETSRDAGIPCDLDRILAKDLAAAAHTRAAQTLAAGIALSKNGAGYGRRLGTLAFEGFDQASRQFVRGLLPFLPLLGFFGTVIGLATAIGELPQGLAGEGGRNFDISGSLAGLAIKFETTLLGLMASLICSFLLGILEKREAELTAECMMIAEAAGGRSG
jgi:MotA/TolQ/ExbB proton channel family